MNKYSLSHLEKLEAESIFIIREVFSEFKNPVMLYSIGKDSSVMLHLASKAFAPGKIPFPLMHIDTQWKFQDMYKFRTEIVERYNADLKVWTNPDGKDKMNPFDDGSEKYTQVMKTEALKQALSHYKFDSAFGGARRDEEKSRAKERIYSFRDEYHQWDPKNQRPELWNIYNANINEGESIRAFPLSNWTELDIWMYILKEDIPIVPLYTAKERPVVNVGGTLIMVDDDRMDTSGLTIENKSVRFRTLGCYPLTGAVESDADTIEKVIQETILATTSERQGRVIDSDNNSSMEEKKRDGYF